jgi:hypothetical protein
VLLSIHEANLPEVLLRDEELRIDDHPGGDPFRIVPEIIIIRNVLQI